MRHQTACRRHSGNSGLLYFIVFVSGPKWPYYFMSTTWWCYCHQYCEKFVLFVESTCRASVWVCPGQSMCSVWARRSWLHQGTCLLNYSLAYAYLLPLERRQQVTYFNLAVKYSLGCLSVLIQTMSS